MISFIAGMGTLWVAEALIVAGYLGMQLMTSQGRSWVATSTGLPTTAMTVIVLAVGWPLSLPTLLIADIWRKTTRSRT